MLFLSHLITQLNSAYEEDSRGKQRESELSDANQYRLQVS